MENKQFLETKNIIKIKYSKIKKLISRKHPESRKKVREKYERNNKTCGRLIWEVGILDGEKGKKEGMVFIKKSYEKYYQK